MKRWTDVRAFDERRGVSMSQAAEEIFKLSVERGTVRELLALDGSFRTYPKIFGTCVVRKPVNFSTFPKVSAAQFMKTGTHVVRAVVSCGINTVQILHSNCRGQIRIDKGLFTQRMHLPA
jgi:hypothetical protein